MQPLPLSRREFLAGGAAPAVGTLAAPDFKAIDLICEKAAKAGDRAALVDLGAIAERARG